MLKEVGLKEIKGPLLANPVRKKDLSDPNSKETQFILWLYSTFPSLNADLEKASKLIDKTAIENLGPMAFALNSIVKLTELNKGKDETTLGKELHNPKGGKFHDLGYWSCADMVFKGTRMKTAQISEWSKLVGAKGLKNTGNEIENGLADKPA